VYLLSAGDTDYVALAMDCAPGEPAGLDAELIGYQPTLEGAHEVAARWMARNPKGILGDGDGGGDGMASKLWAVLSKLDQSDSQDQEDTKA